MRLGFAVVVVAAALLTGMACSLPSVDEYASGGTEDGGKVSAGPEGGSRPEGGSVPGPAEDSGTTDAGVVNLLEGNVADFEKGTCDGA